MNKGKNILKSKTFWLNALSIAGMLVQAKTGFVVDPASQAIALGFVNTLIRTVTKEPITWQKD
jgi:hypothetical protein